MKMILKFLGVGAFTTASTYLLYLVLVRFLDFRLAYVICYGVGMVLNFFLHSGLVFEVTVSLKKAFGYLASHAVLVTTGRIVVKYLVLVLGVPLEVAPLIAIPLMLPISYVVFRKVLNIQV